MSNTHSRRSFLKKAAALSVAVPLGIAELDMLSDLRKSPNQLLLNPWLEGSNEELATNNKLLQLVENNHSEEIAKLLKTIPDTDIQIVVPSFIKALQDGKITAMEAFLDRFPTLANAMFKSVFFDQETPMELAISANNKEAVYSKLLEKGARFDLTARPERIVSSSSYNGDIDFLQFIDRHGFKFPEMNGYYKEVGANSPYKSLTDGAKWEATDKEKLVQVAKFLRQKGYNPLENQGLAPKENALDYANHAYNQTKDAIDTGVLAPHRKLRKGLIEHEESKIPAEESQNNLAALILYFKTLKRQQQSQSAIR